MTAIDPNGWKALASRLSDLVSCGSSPGQAMRDVYSDGQCSLLLLKRAIQEVFNLSSVEASKLIAAEITLFNAKAGID
jgi:thiamine monophosphate kinase